MLCDLTIQKFFYRPLGWREGNISLDISVELKTILFVKGPITRTQRQEKIQHPTKSFIFNRNLSGGSKK